MEPRGLHPGRQELIQWITPMFTLRRPHSFVSNVPKDPVPEPLCTPSLPLPEVDRSSCGDGTCLPIFKL